MRTSLTALLLLLWMNWLSSASAQQQSSIPPNAPRYDIGTVSGDSYSNECMGFSLTIPVGWTFAKEQGDTDTMRIGTHMGAGSMTLLSLRHPTDPPYFNPIIVIAQDASRFNGTAQEYVSRTVQGWIERYPTRYELLRNAFPVEYGGKQFYRADYKQNLQKADAMYSAYVFTKFRGYMLGAIVTTRSSTDLDQQTDILQHLRFTADQVNPACAVGDNTLSGRVVGVIGSIQSGGAKPSRVRVSSMVATGLLIKKIDPQFPDALREAGVQGPVVLRILISKEGDVEPNIAAVSGDPKLVPPAVDAVKAWKYKPYTLNGEAVEVETTVTIPYPPQ